MMRAPVELEDQAQILATGRVPTVPTDVLKCSGRFLVIACSVRGDLPFPVRCTGIVMSLGFRLMDGAGEGLWAGVRFTLVFTLFSTCRRTARGSSEMVHAAGNFSGEILTFFFFLRGDTSRCLQRSSGDGVLSLSLSPRCPCV